MQNSIKRYRVVKLKSIEDEFGVAQTTVWGEPLTRALNKGTVELTEIKPMSLFPTLPIGSKSEAMPGVGQIVLGYRSEYPNVIYSVGYISEEETPLQISKKSLSPGEFRFRYEGLDSTEFSFKHGRVGLLAGLGVSFDINKETKKATLSADNYNHTFAGGSIKSIRFADRSDFTSNTMIYTKYKELHVNSDKHKEHEDSIVTSTADYVDKVIIKAGGIHDLSGVLLKPADHLYQLDVLQSLSARALVTQKDTITSLKLGAKKSGALRGSIIDWSYKKRKSPLFLDTMVHIHGLLDDGTVTREQHIINMQNPSVDPTDFMSKGNGYDLHVIGEVFDTLNTFWWMKAANDGTDGYYLREAVGLANNIHNFTEVSDSSYYLHTNTKFNTQEYTAELTEDNYKVELKYGTDVTYLLNFGQNGIEISLDTGDEKTSPSVTLTKDAGINITSGTGLKAGSINITSDGVAQELVTKSWLDLVFANHMHPTAAPGAPSPPVPLPVLGNPSATSHLTNITKVQ